MNERDDGTKAEQSLQAVQMEQAMLQTSVEALHRKQLGGLDSPQEKQEHQQRMDAAKSIEDKHERLHASIDALGALQKDIATTPEQQQAAERQTSNLHGRANQLRQDEKQAIDHLQAMQDKLPANKNLHAVGTDQPAASATPYQPTATVGLPPEGLPIGRPAADNHPPGGGGGGAAPITDEQIARDFNAPPPPPPPPPPKDRSLSQTFNEVAGPKL